MSTRDKRVKGCPNEACPRYKKHKYLSTDNFCTICGTHLEFICAECFGPIEELGPKHRICGHCEAKKHDDGVLAHKARKVGGKIADSTKKGAHKVVKIASEGIIVVKENAPIVKAKVVKIAKNPKVKRLANDVADVAIEELASRVKKVIKKGPSIASIKQK